MANWANIGIGVAGALRGFKEGQETGQSIKDIQTERRLKGIREAGMETARGQREQDIQGQIRTLDTGGFQVGDQTFTDQASAKKAAEGSVDDVLDYYSREVMPQLRDAYIADGDIEKASAYEKWTEDREVKRGMKHWANGMRAFVQGDITGAANAMVRAVNTPGYGMGGVKAARPIEQDGRVVGIEYDLDDGKGGVRTEKVEGEEMLRRGLMSLTPDAMFAALYAEQTAADKARIDAAKETRKQGLQMEREVAVEGVRQGNREALADRNFNNAVDLTRLKSQLDAAAKRAAAQGGGNSPILRDYNATVQVLMQGGKPEPEARRLASERVIYRLSMSPQDRVRETMADLAKTDLRFSKLPQAEQIAKVRQVMDAEDALVQELTGGAGGAPGVAAPAPAVGGPGGGLDWYEDEEDEE